jgi:hypothetical protein
MEDDFPRDTAMDTMDSDMEPVSDDFQAEDCSTDHLQQAQDHFVEEYAGAAKTYGQGSSFMDNFDADEYAEHRKANVYFPFASRDEWELASFLLRSSLSMSEVDTFLSLKLVRPSIPSFRVLLNNWNRLDTSAYRFVLQRTCVAGQRCFQRAPHGAASH